MEKQKESLLNYTFCVQCGTKSERVTNICPKCKQLIKPVKMKMKLGEKIQIILYIYIIVLQIYQITLLP
jgi:predicted amidophosphoribosyltransferase